MSVNLAYSPFHKNVKVIDQKTAHENRNHTNDDQNNQYKHKSPHFLNIENLSLTSYFKMYKPRVFYSKTATN